MDCIANRHKVVDEIPMVILGLGGRCIGRLEASCVDYLDFVLSADKAEVSALT